MYEEVAEKLLLDFPTAVLVDALAHQPSTADQLEGAARYFAGWEFRKHSSSDMQQIPSELKRRLWTHSLTSSDPDRLQWARNAFG